MVEQCSAALRGIESISQRVGQLLSSPPALVEQLNSMEAQAYHQRVLEESRKALAMLRGEPTIAMVDFQWEDSGVTERFFFCRGAAAGILPEGLNGKLVSYLGELGRMVPVEPGDSVVLKLRAGEREGFVLKRARVRAILDLTKGISTMLAAVSRRLRRHQGERLWDSGPLRATLKRGRQLLQPGIPRLVGG